MEVLRWIVENADNIVTVIIIIAAIVTVIGTALKHGETKKITQEVLSMITNAENKNGPGTGDLKFSQVAESIYAHMPAGLKVFFTAKDIENLINKSVEAAKKYWDEHPDAIDTESMPKAEIENAVDDAADEVIKN